MIEILDEDGNALTPPEPGTDTANLIYLLEYGRKRGFRIGPLVTIGSITVQVNDVRQARVLAESVPNDRSELDPDSDMAIVMGIGGDQ